VRRRLATGALAAALALSTAAHAAPPPALSAVNPRSLCPTRGQVAHTKEGYRVLGPKVRAIAAGSTGDIAELRFVYLGASAEGARLASGQLRRQLGLKLRAADGCNLVYVMWRIEPTPGIEISIKRNPGERTHAECGADGYTKVAHVAEVPTLRVSAKRVEHVLRARISGEVLDVSVDGRRVWRGALGDGLRGLAGPAGVRSDNVAFDFELRAERAASGAATCAAGLLDDG
jgi:hypothetical protein